MLSTMTPDRAQWIVTLGIPVEAEVKQILAEAASHIENPGTTMGTPRFVQCWGFKPKLPNDNSPALWTLEDVRHSRLPPGWHDAPLRDSSRTGRLAAKARSSSRPPRARPGLIRSTL